MFVDLSRIRVRSGAGGAGAVSFHRAKFVPKGGPDGGDGGRGGSVIFLADPQLTTLLDFKYRRKFFAEDGQPGGANFRSGKAGGDVLIRVPLGTVVKDAASKTVILDMVAPGKKTVLLKGGLGGRGNARFATSTNRTPRYAQPGRPGLELELELELKVMAEVGLVGFPNAGKSTLLAAVSKARPKIAPYPFTTLTPQLGIVEFGPYQNFVMADIPGLISGAHEGKGLGHRFLRHLERTRILLFLLDITGENPGEELETLRGELRSHNPDLLRKPQLVVFTKSDLLPREEFVSPIPEALVISAVARRGLTELVGRLGQMVSAARRDDPGEYARENQVNELFLEELWEAKKSESEPAE
jgi:GTP-binding protein